MLTLSFAFSLNAFGQIDKPLTKGNLNLEGGGSIQYSKINSDFGISSSKTNIFTISLDPGFAYFIIDNMAVGLNATFSYYAQKNNSYYTLGIGPMIKYYFKNGIFVKAVTSYSFLHGMGSNDQANNYFSLKPGAGYAFFLNQKVSLEPCLIYEFDNIKLNSGSGTMVNKVNNIMVELKLNIFL